MLFSQRRDTLLRPLAPSIVERDLVGHRHEIRLIAGEWWVQHGSKGHGPFDSFAQAASWWHDQSIRGRQFQAEPLPMLIALRRLWPWLQLLVGAVLLFIGAWILSVAWLSL